MAAKIGLSTRGLGNVNAVLPKISAAVEERAKKGNKNIDMGTSENWLIRQELIALCKDAIQEGLAEKVGMAGFNLVPKKANAYSQHLSYPDGFAGDTALLESLAAFFNQYFKPVVPVDVSHLATAPGAAASLDALLYNICEPGDGVLVPGPFWSKCSPELSTAQFTNHHSLDGFDWLFNVRSGVQPVLVNVDSLDHTFTSNLIPQMTKAMEESTRPIKGLVLTNPHNPFGQCYPKAVIEKCMKFCHERHIHFISDEVYGMSGFTSEDFPKPTPFVSALSIDVCGLGYDLSQVHTIWSISKDFGSSGFRMVGYASSLNT